MIRRTIAASVASLLGLAIGARADEGVALVTLECGASIGFALVRTGAQGESAAMGDAALPRSNTVSRVLWDRESGAYFGYRIEVQRKPGERPFRVALKPLDPAAVERELKERANCPGCPAPVPLAAAGLLFPGPQQLADGEALTVELLANPKTGDRIFDVLKLSAQPLAAEAMRAAVARAREAHEAQRRAAAFHARADFPAAVAEYKRALLLLPNDASLHNKLGICYQRAKDETRARREYERALEINPAYSAAWNNLGTLEQSRKRFRDAVRSYKKAIEIKPNLATAWKNLANAHLALGQFREAFEAYEEAFRLDPAILESEAAGVPAAGVDAATQNFYFAKLLASKGQIDGALDYLRRAREAGFRDWGRLERDGVFRGVVRDPRYKEILQR